MTTLLWQRPTDFQYFPHSDSRYKWSDVKVWKRKATYQLAVDAEGKALETLMAREGVKESNFTYRALRKPVRMEIDGNVYRLWYIKKI